MKIYSERLPLKYLFSDRGICFGADTKKASFLLLITTRGIIFRKRPAGDTIVERLEYDVDSIHDYFQKRRGRN